MSQKYFPIQTDTSCRLKWSQNSIWLNNGKIGYCCKARIGPIGDNFYNFHNTDLKIKSRRDMLAGIWRKTFPWVLTELEKNHVV